MAPDGRNNVKEPSSIVCSISILATLPLAFSLRHPLIPVPTSLSACNHQAPTLSSPRHLQPSLLSSHTTLSGQTASMITQPTATFSLSSAVKNYAQIYSHTGFRNFYWALYTMLSGKLISDALQSVDTVAYPFPNETAGGLI